MLTIDNVRSTTQRVVQDKQLFTKLGLQADDMSKARRIFSGISHDQAAINADRVISELGYTDDDAKTLMFKSGLYYGRNYELFEALRMAA